MFTYFRLCSVRVSRLISKWLQSALTFGPSGPTSPPVPGSPGSP